MQGATRYYSCVRLAMTDVGAAKPRLGFLGLGRIGRMRMQSLLQADAAAVVALADPDAASMAAARAMAPNAKVCDSLEQLLAQPLDGLVIATPNALHYQQALVALTAGVAVFCQKPLAVNASHSRELLATARGYDRLLAVDWCHRHLRGMQRIKQMVQEGALGDVYALSLAYHNAFGPDRPWFYRRETAGGGCVLDLGGHLIDLALWLFDYPAVELAAAHCHAGGQWLAASRDQVEDYASLQLVLADAVTVDIACSWHLPLGRDADIRIACHGTRGGAVIGNVNGSFHDFRSERHDGRATEVLYEPEEEGDWGGRAVLAWVRRLARDAHFDPRVASNVVVAEVIDAVYAHTLRPSHHVDENLVTTL